MSSKTINYLRWWYFTFIVLVLFWACIACVVANDPGNINSAPSPLPTLVAALALGGVNFHGDAVINGSSWSGCVDSVKDSTKLKVGFPREDGLVRVELEMVVPYIWDADCAKTSGSNYYYGAGDYSPNTQTITFFECAGDSASGTGTLIAKDGSSGLPDFGFDGVIECTWNDETTYKIEFTVRYNPLEEDSAP